MDEAARNKLWSEYSRTRSTALRDQLIIEYSQLVKLVAGRLGMYLGYSVEYDDLCGYGIFGLIDAIDKFDCNKNVKFETYASLRIRGAILDQIRKMDWIPRSLRQKQKKIDAAMSKIEAQKGSVATDEELAQELGITLDEFNDWQGKTKATNLISLDEYTETQGTEAKMDSVTNARFDQPEDVVEKEELKKMMKGQPTPDGGNLFLVYDLDGKLIRKFLLDHYTNGIDVHEDSNILYTVSSSEENAINKYRLPL